MVDTVADHWTCAHLIDWNDGWRTRQEEANLGHKVSAMRILTQVDELLSATDPASTSDIVKPTQLKLSLQEKLDTLKCLDDEILKLTEEAKVEDEIAQTDSSKKGFTQRQWRLCVTTPPPSSDAPPHGDTAHTTETAERTYGHRVKLSKLTIWAFNGDITTWTTFWDSYESATHNNSDLSDIDKFNHLKSLLERTASEAISGLTLTSTNYHETVSILKRRLATNSRLLPDIWTSRLTLTQWLRNITWRVSVTYMTLWKLTSTVSSL